MERFWQLVWGVLHSLRSVELTGGARSVELTGGVGCIEIPLIPKCQFDWSAHSPTCQFDWSAQRGMENTL